MNGPPALGAGSRPEQRAGAGQASALIERDEPWDLATQALAAACSGSGSLSVIEGTSGLGKTELLSAIRRASAELDMDVLSAAGQAHEQDFRFGLVLQLLEARVGRADEQERSDLLGGSARDAMPLFAHGSGAEQSDPSFDLLHALYRLCATLAERRPLVLAVDDADLADESSLRFLLHLEGRLEELPIAVFLTTGTVPPSEAHPLLGAIVGHPAARSRRLEPLSPEASAHRVRDTWLPGAPESVCRAIHDASAGNPLLIDKLAAELLAANGSVGLTSAGVDGLAPRGIADWALTVADRLDPRAPGLLKALATLGPDAELRHLAALRGIEPEQTATIAGRLIETGLLRDGEPLSFAHRAVGSAVDGSLSSLERATLQRRASRLMCAEDAPAERVASHLMAATRTGSAWAVESLRTAARGALEAGRPADAVRYLRRALEEPPPRRLRSEVVFELGCAEATAGVPDAAARLSGAVGVVAESHQRVGSPLEVGRALFALGRPDEAQAILELGLEQAGHDDLDLSQRLHATHACTGLFAQPDGLPLPDGPPAGDETAGERALLAVHAVDGAIRGRRFTEVRDLAARSLGRGRLLEDETADGPVYYLPVFAIAIAEDLQTAEAALTAAVEEARGRGSMLGFANASYLRSVAILLRGRIGDAAADARQALAAERHGWQLSHRGARAVLANCLVERGDRKGARRHLTAAEKLPHAHSPTWGAVLLTRARVELLEGQVEKALADYKACGELGEAAGMNNPALSPWRSGAAIASSLLGRQDEAVELAEAELGLAERFGSPGAIGRALRALGTVRGPERGLEALEAAADRLEHSQAALERAYALVEFGAALRRSGRRRDARKPLRHGLDLAQRCGAEALVSRAKDEAKIAGARPRRTAVSGVEALTARERQVVELAVRGMSNRQIADALVVTVKTVEWHLGHSFRKLEVDSRAKLRELFGE